jgi:competence protein ComEC
MRAPPDLRAVALAGAAWAGALVAFLLQGVVVAVVLGVATAVVVHRRRRGSGWRTGAAALLVAAAVAGSAMLHVAGNRDGPVAGLANAGAYVEVTGVVRTDPVLRPGKYEPFTLTRLPVRTITGRGRTFATDVPVLVLADRSWTGVALGSVVRASGRLGVPDGADLAAVLSTNRPAVVLDPPGRLLQLAARVRAGIRAAVAPAGPDERALVPALVVGDDQRMSDQVVADFRTCGLSHLAAVSGTNLTLVVGFLLLVARWAGVRGRGLVVVGVLGLVAFVVLARPEPSVVRAAAMGSVALLGMGLNGRERGVRALGVAVLALLLLDPWLALSPGFVLSAAATAGILFLAPPFRDRLMRWMPRWLAEAVAVPFAAQLACTPIVAGISGQVSVVAVLANMLVAAVVGPATVLGLLGGVLVLGVPPAGLLCGRMAGWCAGWIITVATRLADLPGAAVDWSARPVPLALLTLACFGVALAAHRLMATRRLVLPAVVLIVLGMVRPLPTPGWPPAGWVLVACDVGQGDALVLNAGSGRAVVVDAGPEPAAVRGCLDRLEVTTVPVVVLSHFHADHVDGLPGVLASHRPAEIDVTRLRDPPSGAAAVDRWAAAAGIPVRVPAFGETRRLGTLTWQVVGPDGSDPTGAHGEEGSPANNASLVLLIEVAGVRLLLAGDMEPEAQEELARNLPGLRVDVLKVPHHGSRYQDPDLLAALGARVAVISVGVDNDYGHPASSTLALLHTAGMLVRRTDRDGDVAVLVRDGRLAVRTRR